MSSGRATKCKAKSSHGKRHNHDAMDAEAVPPPARAIKVEDTPVEPFIEKERDPLLSEELGRPIAQRAGNEENHNGANQGTLTMRPKAPGLICTMKRSPFRSPIHPALNFAPASSAFHQPSPACSSFSVRQMTTPSAADCHRQLFSVPLLQTPLDAPTPHCSVPTGVSATKGVFFRPMTPESSGKIQSSSTPGLDLLADQSLVHRRGHPSHPGHPFFVNRTTMCSFQDPYHQRILIPPNYAPRSLPQPVPHCSNPGRPFMPGHDVSKKLGTVETLEKESTGTRNRVPKKRNQKPIPRYQPPIDPVTMYPLLFREAKTSSKPCHCANSKCLKLYCECFHKGLLCDPNFCNCKDCSNSEENNGVKGPREYAILKILAKRPDAFTLRAKKPDRCTCPKNNCLKRYCECFSVGRPCTGKCKCIGCLN